MSLSGRPVVRSVIVANPLGLHLRACAEIAKTASAFDAQATIRRGHKQADAESVSAMMSVVVCFMMVCAFVFLVVRSTGPCWFIAVVLPGIDLF